MRWRSLGWMAIVGIWLAGCSAPSQTSHPPHPRFDLAQQYGRIAGTIIHSALNQNDSWQKMRELCDGIGHRLSGSDALNRAIDWAVAEMKRDGQSMTLTKRY